MSDTSSVYKICPQCGQSVSVAAKFCPTCGAAFTEESADFVAYERYQDPPAIGNQTNANNMDNTMTFTPVSGHSPDAGYGMYPGPDQGGSAETKRQPRPASQEAEDAAHETGINSTVAKFSRKRAGQTEAVNSPGVRTNPFQDDRKRVLIVSIAAAVVLLVVIAAGIIMAFQLGIFGSNQSDDPMTLAQEQYNLKNYDEAISQLEKLVADGNATQETYELLADAYNDKEDPDAAADAYLRGYQNLKEGTLRKSAINAYLKLGDTAKAEGDLSKAKEYYDTILEKLDPSNSVAISSLASLKNADVSPSPSPSASARPSASPVPSVSPTLAPPSGPAPSGGQIIENENAVVTPTPKPSPTPTPTPKPSSTPTAKPSPSPSPKPSPTPSPSPSPSPTPRPSTTFTLDGHSYQLIIGDFTWWEAKADAESRGGHIVSINSEEEFNQCAKVAADSKLVHLWLNAYVNDVADWSSTTWLNGDAFSYTPWLKGEPSGGDEYYLSMISVNGTWYYNDDINAITEYPGKRGYILEKDS